MVTGNQGRDIDQVLEDVGHKDLMTASMAALDEAYDHGGEATCACVAIETLAVLYELGYRMMKIKEK